MTGHQGKTALMADYEYERLSFAQFTAVWEQHRLHFSRIGPFMTPAWLASWCHWFGGTDCSLLLFSKGGEALGLAPLLEREGRVSLIGSADLCDHLDLLAFPGKEELLCKALLCYLENTDQKECFIHSCRVQSIVQRYLIPLAAAQGWQHGVTPAGAAVQMPLAPDWQGYLGSLKGKHRHEIRRKERRLHEAGELGWRRVEAAKELGEAMDIFCHWFRASRTDKAAFLTGAKEGFFKEVAERLQGMGLLNLQQLLVNQEVVAMVFCIDFGDVCYLYNNGYNPEFRHLSIGQISKLMSVRDSIARGQSHYDFLNGTERYKFELGGTAIALSSCRIVRAKQL